MDIGESVLQHYTRLNLRRYPGAIESKREREPEFNSLLIRLGLATREEALCAVNASGLALPFLSTDSRSDAEICNIAVGVTGDVLDVVPEVLQTRELCLLSANTPNITRATNKTRNIRFVPDRWKYDKEFLCAYLAQNGNQLDGIRSLANQNDQRMISYYHDKELCLLAVQSDPNAIQYVPDELQDDEDIAFAVCSRDGYLLSRWFERAVLPIINNRRIVLAALENHPGAYKFVGQTLKQDPDVLKKTQ